MATVYFSREDYRHDMQYPHGSTRAHAVCRRLIATADQNSKLYGAVYWAACAATAWRDSSGAAVRRAVYRDYRRRFACEVEHGLDDAEAWATIKSRAESMTRHLRQV